MIKRLHHVGIAVKDIKESAVLFERLLRLKPVNIEEVPSQKVNEAVFKVGGEVEIDLLEPTGPDSAVAKFLEKHGGGLHHICFEVDDIDRELKTMEESGTELIDRQGRKGAAGRIGFLHPKSTGGVLIELVQCQD